MDETSVLNAYEAQVREYENGIFNLVITLARVKASRMPATLAYADVAAYLSRLAEGLTMEQQKHEGE